MSAVWEVSGQTGGNLLVLLALADFANDAGECWPAVATLAKKSRLTDRHVRRVLRELADSGEIEALESPGFHGTIRYRVTPKAPDSSPGADILSGGHPMPPTLTSDAPSPDAGVSQSVMEPREPSDSEKFVEFFIDLLRETKAPDPKMTPAREKQWAKVYDDLMRLDARTKEEIVKVCRWARRDQFWARNFLSPLKLRAKNRDGVSYYDVFLNNLSHANSTHPGSNGRSFEHAGDYAGIQNKL